MNVQDNTQAEAFEGERQIIDLEPFAAGAARLLGRPKGEAVRRELHLKEIDANSEKYVFAVPDYVKTVGLSFFLGLLSPSVTRFGSRQHFFNKYKFRATNKKVISDIVYGARRSLGEPDDGSS